MTTIEKEKKILTLLKEELKKEHLNHFSNEGIEVLAKHLDLWDLEMEKIISKIKKLLEMTEANGASENEAMTAALKAQKLMAEYHISEKEIGEKEKSDKIVMKHTFIGTGNKWKYALTGIVGKNFRCEHFFDTKHSNLYFYGYNVDVEIAIKTFEMLFEIGKKTSVRCYNRIRNNCIKSGKNAINNRRLTTA